MMGYNNGVEDNYKEMVALSGQLYRRVHIIGGKDDLWYEYCQ